MRKCGSIEILPLYIFLPQPAYRLSLLLTRLFPRWGSRTAVQSIFLLRWATKQTDALRIVIGAVLECRALILTLGRMTAFPTYTSGILQTTHSMLYPVMAIHSCLRTPISYKTEMPSFGPTLPSLYMHLQTTMHKSTKSAN